jgi:hypothetical protein
MIDVKASIGDRVDFDPRSMPLDKTLDVGWTIDTTANKLHCEFEDQRMQGEQIPSRSDWPFLALWLSSAAGILSIAVWALI